MTLVPLDLCFKGARNYVQGGDLFNALCAHLGMQFPLGEITDLNYVIYRMSTTALESEIHPFVPAAPASPARTAVLNFHHHGTRWNISAYETGRPICCRKPYDEDFIATRCAVDVEKREIVLVQQLGFTLVEILVTMTKVLHQRIFGAVAGRWLFCRLEAPALCLDPSPAEIRLRLLHASGTRLTRSAAEIAGVPWGMIYFSLSES
jgi:hypothetical protein